MFNKILFFIVFSVIYLPNYGQNSIDKNWQFGIGASLVKFSDADVAFIGDKHLIQLPRLNATKRINSNFSVDAAFSFGNSDSSIIVNNLVPYFSFDVSGRYRYLKSIPNLDPFVFIGGSLVDSKRKMTPTANIGTGATYWLSKFIGISGQVYYKYSMESFESMRSHFQLTGGLVFSFDNGKSSRGKSSNGSSRCYYDPYKVY